MTVTIKLASINEFDVDTIMVVLKRLCLTPLSPEEMNRIGPADLVNIAGEIADFFRPVTPQYPKIP